jgi:SAM-dependent methyltransferase
MKITDKAYRAIGVSAGWDGANAAADLIKTSILDRFVVGQTVLDVGCASGLYADYLARMGKTVVGMDVDVERLKAARARTKAATFIRGDITTVDLKAKSFETIVLFDVLEHVDEQVAMEQLVRLAKKRIIITVPATTHRDLTDLYLLYGHHQDPTHLRTYTKAKLEGLAAQYRLRPVALEPIHPISTDALFLEILEGPLLLRRLLRKLAFTVAKPKRFDTNWLLVADVV